MIRGDVIFINKGDDLQLEFEVVDFRPENGDTLQMVIKNTSQQQPYDTTINLDEYGFFNIPHTLTATLDGVYIYEIKLISEEQEIYTAIKSELIIR